MATDLSGWTILSLILTAANIDSRPYYPGN